MGRGICCVVLLWAAVSVASEPPRAEFTATYLFRAKGGKGAPRKQKLYVGRDVMRLDDEDASGFKVKDRSKGTVIAVDLKRSIRTKSSWSGFPSEVAPGEPPCGKAPTCVQLKTEVRKGRRVEKWKETNPNCLGCETSFIWVDRALGFAVRLEMVGIEVHELTNIRRGAPPARMLAIPAGLRDPSEPDVAERTACKRQGGTYERGSGRGWWQCNLPMKDAGTPCSSGTDCQSGTCVAPKGAHAGTRTSGTCQAMRFNDGCSTKVERGVVQQTICS